MMNHPKATLLTLEQSLEQFTDDQLTDVVKAANRLFSLGVGEKIDTRTLTQTFIDNTEMNKFIAATLHSLNPRIPLEECTVESDAGFEFIELAEAFAVLAAAVYWRCKGSERLTETNRFHGRHFPPDRPAPSLRTTSGVLRGAAFLSLRGS